MNEKVGFKGRFTEIARRFLLTSVIVDDKAQIPSYPDSTKHLTKPDRRSLANVQEGTTNENTVNSHSLDARSLVDSFAKHGLICAVIAPPEDDSLTPDTILPAAKRADMVILDWQMYQDEGRTAVGLTKNLLKDDDVGRLRLIAIYTGEDKLPKIGRGLKDELARQGWDFHSEDPFVELTHGHCRIVIYAKSHTSLGPDLKDRAVAENDLPDRLIGDFVEMTKGLLPSIALTSLAAVRENVHKVLDSFTSELDPAFLAHRASLPIPDDSQSHMVSLLDSELHAIMDDATMKIDPTNLDAIKDWLNSNYSQETMFCFGDRQLSYDDVVRLLNEGIKRNQSLTESYFDKLSAGFGNEEMGLENLDQQLAWMFNFRTVSDTQPPILQLGTVLQQQNQDGDCSYFICMRPRCDSIRLDEIKCFPLLPLTEPRQKQIQLVLKSGNSDYKRLSVCTEPTHWSLPKFEPNESRKCVVAERSNGQYTFTSTGENRTSFTWIGELKAEFAQRVAQHFASRLSRVATDNSEWLRRQENMRD